MNGIKSKAKIPWSRWNQNFAFKPTKSNGRVVFEDSADYENLSFWNIPCHSGLPTQFDQQIPTLLHLEALLE